MPAKPSAHPTADGPGPIELRGARTHNLKGIDLELPRAALTVVTGVSGSGKSSLAFDTLYAEGQRRYVESLSTYARQFLEKMPRPPVEAIRNLPPAIALEQKNSVTNARSTVGTATEIHDFLRLLFARVGRLHCPDCEVEVRADTAQSALERLESLPEGSRLVVLAPVAVQDTDQFAPTLTEMRRQGFSRAMDEDGSFLDLEERAAAPPPPPGEPLLLVADRLALRPGSRARLREALELALRAGEGKARVREADSGAEWRFDTALSCPDCGRGFRRPEPALFSFSSPLGACPACQGFGRVTGIDLDRAIPDRRLTLADKPVLPWNSPANRVMYRHLKKKAPELDPDKPLEDFDEQEWRILLHGNGKWKGLIDGFFAWFEERRYKVQARVMLARYRSYTPCPDCGGRRLVPEALAVRLGGRSIAELGEMAVAELRDWFATLALNPFEERAAERLLAEVRARLDYLHRVGLDYLTLSRQARTLSGGEAQRINLATALGSRLTDTLYVLDEPTVGLHARDTDRLLRILLDLRHAGNTVLVVEHDPDILRGADRVVDLGPGAGERGGELLYAGPLDGLTGIEGSQTARYLAEERAGPRPVPARGRPPAGWLTVRGAREHNLRDLDVRLPLGLLCCITGVSGSGKSTLMHDIVHAGFHREKGLSKPMDVGDFDALEGCEQLDDMLLVDQKPLGRSSRSNPVTYVKAYDPIRQLFAATREARREGIQPGFFSFNVPGGRCETCQGAGLVTIDMHFLSDVEVECEDCQGRRFQRRVLEIRWKGRNIDEVLDLTVDEAHAFFDGQAKILAGLEPLRQVGLGYLRLGQSTATLSGGEAQRLKLAGFLAANRKPSARARTAMLFDEPTTGLHRADLERLLQVFHQLVDQGVSLFVIEHNLDLVAHADWVIDLGPEGGTGGGHLVAEGPLAQLLGAGDSHTARHLARRLRARTFPVFREHDVESP